MKDKTTNRKLQAIATKDKIFNAAVKLICRKGIENIVVRDICNAANVSIGLFYHYYKSKDDILFEIYAQGDNYFAQVAANLTAEDAMGKLREYITRYIEFVSTQDFCMVKHLYTSDNKLFAVKGRAMQTNLRDLIQRGQENSEVSSEMAPDETVEFIFVILRGIIFDWCLHDGHYDLRANSKKFIEYICRSLVVKTL